MAFENRLVQKLSQTQSLVITPQLQQAIKLLQLGRLEYQEAIEQELLENPLLEEQREEDPRLAQSASEISDSSSSNDDNSSENSSGENDNSKLGDSKVDWEDYLESFADSHGASTPKGTIDFEEKNSLESTLQKAETLYDYLAQQIRFLNLSTEDKVIAHHIIGNLNKDGYLCVSYEELAEECNTDVLQIEDVIAEIRTLDPVGITARNIQECLLLQLDDIGLSDGIAAKIVQDHLDKLEKKKYDQIAKDLQVPVQEIYQSVTTIQGLEPRPGRQFNNDDIRYVVPDVYVQKVNGEYIITMNEDGLPRLRVSPYYLQVLKNSEPGGDGAKSYLHERLKAASWLIKSIHQRQQTIQKVSESIVKFQKEFLDHGIDKLKPLVLKDVAEDIGMHESTVSRVTTNKYMHTPQGVYELKFFFTTGIKGATGDLSSSSVKERIKILIAAEDNSHPISDQEIVDILQRDRIDIARRTVAKYRESMGIESSAKRKKFF